MMHDQSDLALKDTRIFMIHALEESVQPAREAFSSGWPEAYVFDLLDTSIAVDLDHAGELDERMMERFVTLAEYARGSSGKGGSTAALLFTCSAFGPAIEVVKKRVDIPVLRPNEAAFDAAIRSASRIGLIVTFEPSKASLLDELNEMAHQRGAAIEVSAITARGALTALKKGDGGTHDQLVLEAARSLETVDLIVLGQFSMARAKQLLDSELSVPVITTPEAAVAALKSRTTGRPGGPHGLE